MSSIRLWSLVSFLLAVFLGLLYSERISQLEVSRIPERFHWRSNEALVDVQNCDDLAVFWVAYRVDPQVPDTVELYSNGRSSAEIEDAYGKNYFLVKKKGNIVYDKIGIYKFKSWYKHDYIIHIKCDTSKMSIQWTIKNAYESFEQTDTVWIR